MHSTNLQVLLVVIGGFIANVGRGAEVEFDREDVRKKLWGMRGRMIREHRAGRVPFTLTKCVLLEILSLYMGDGMHRLVQNLHKGFGDSCSENIVVLPESLLLMLAPWPHRSSTTPQWIGEIL